MTIDNAYAEWLSAKARMMLRPLASTAQEDDEQLDRDSQGLDDLFWKVVRMRSECARQIALKFEMLLDEFVDDALDHRARAMLESIRADVI